ncbi:MAG: hypothetical protein AAFO07_12480 [Bacteroidota bacterium]
MKRLLVFLLFACCAFSLSAQHESLFGRTRLVGAFGAPIVEIGYKNSMNTGVGFGGALVFSDFFLGAYGIANGDFDGWLEDDDLDKLDLGHGGLWLGFTPARHRLVHLYTSARVGWGAVDIDLRDGGVRYSELDKVFVFTPEAGLELNIFRWLRVAGTFSYRMVSGLEENSVLSNDDLTGAMTNITVRIGGFGRSRY